MQPIERINGKFVVFSEGNLVSNQSAVVRPAAATQDGLIALLHFKAIGDRVEVRRVTYAPTWVRLGDYVVPAGEALGHAAALRALARPHGARGRQGRGLRARVLTHSSGRRQEPRARRQDHVKIGDRGACSGLERMHGRRPRDSHGR